MRTFVESAAAPPWPPGPVHPAGDRAAEHSLGWARAHGLVPTPRSRRRLAAADVAQLAARVCPEAAESGLFLVADLVTWLFAFDDLCDRGRLGADPARLTPVVDGLLSVLDRPATGSQPSTPGQLALDDLCRRIDAYHHPVLRRRFGVLLRRYLRSLLWEATNRRHGRVPELADYIRMRRHTGAVLPSFVVTDLACLGGPARAAAAPDPRRTRLNLLAADLVCWSNDLFSYAREDDGHNLVAVIARHRGCDEAAALAAAARRFADRLVGYQRLEGEVLADADPAVREVVAARRRWIRATYDWSVHAPRYA